VLTALLTWLRPSLSGRTVFEPASFRLDSPLHATP
jgi:hypothetical protein